VTYVRVSLMKPLTGRGLEVQKLNAELVNYYRNQPGCIQSVLVRATGDSGEVGRISFWESENAADQAANSHHSLAMRSRLHLMLRRGHQERSFHAE